MSAGGGCRGGDQSGHGFDPHRRSHASYIVLVASTGRKKLATLCCSLEAATRGGGGGGGGDGDGDCDGDADGGGGGGGCGVSMAW